MNSALKITLFVLFSAVYTSFAQDFPSTTTTATPSFPDADCTARVTRSACEGPFPLAEAPIELNPMMRCRWANGACTQSGQSLVHFCFAIEKTGALSRAQFLNLRAGLSNLVAQFDKNSWVGMVTFGEEANIHRQVIPTGFKQSSVSVFNHMGHNDGAPTTNNGLDGITECINQLGWAQKGEAVEPGRMVIIPIVASEQSSADLCSDPVLSDINSLDMSLLMIYANSQPSDFPSNSWPCLATLNPTASASIAISVDTVPTIDINLFDEFFIPIRRRRQRRLMKSEERNRA